MSVQKPTPEELRAILDAHARWTRGENGGSRADLFGANLFGANLFRANLTGARMPDGTIHK